MIMNFVTTLFFPVEGKPSSIGSRTIPLDRLGFKVHDFWVEGERFGASLVRARMGFPWNRWSANGLNLKVTQNGNP